MSGYVFVCGFVYVYVYGYVFVFELVFVLAFGFVFVYAYVCVYVYVYVCVCVCKIRQSARPFLFQKKTTVHHAALSCTAAAQVPPLRNEEGRANPQAKNYFYF